MVHNYDVIIVGAGSIGVPTAMALTSSGIKTLVIDTKPSPGQGDNKKAIGGVRATHSDPAKIMIGKRSLEIFSTWQQLHGDKIEWMSGGYLFPVYRNKEKLILTSLLSVQKKFDLKINFIDSSKVKKIAPEIKAENLMGGSFSPDDGSASPLLSTKAFTKKALGTGTKFKFKENVQKIILNKNKVTGVETDKGRYTSPIVVDAAGAHSAKLCQTIGVNVPVLPESHEAAITEPIEHLFKCMIVDLRKGPGSKNFYLYQNLQGQIIFCITPDPPIAGTSTDETSSFLPQVCKRIVDLIPALHTVRVRRVWRGCYPMTPDGSPILGWNGVIDGLFHSTGMCGQGFMLGPGMGELASRIITQTCTEIDNKILKNLSPQRKFSAKQEALK